MPRAASVNVSPKKRNGRPVIKGGGPVYRVRWWDPISRRQHEQSVTGYEAALGRKLEILNALTRDRSPARPKRITVTGAFADYIEEFKVKPDGKPRPLASVTNEIHRFERYIQPVIGNAYLDSLDLPDLHDLVRNVRRVDGELVSPATRSAVAGVLKRFFRWARYSRLIPENVALELRTGWGASLRRRHIIPSLPQVEAEARLVDSIKAGDGDIVRLLAYTGMRWEEAVAVDIDAVDLQAQLIAIRGTASEASGRRDIRDSGKSNAALRIIVIPDEAMPAVRRLVDRALEGQLRHGAGKFRQLISGAHGGYYSYSTWTRRIRQVRELAGPDTTIYSAHELRHVAASILIASGATDMEIANQMGHSKASVTRDIYGHLFAIDRALLLAEINKTVSRLWVEAGEESNA